MPKRILLGDDHPMIRKGLIVHLDHYFADVEVDEACSCNEIMKKLSLCSYSHLILDIILPDGIILEILPNIVTLYPTTKILIFSMQPPEIYKRALLRYGIHYFLSKKTHDDTITVVLEKFLTDTELCIEPGMPAAPDNSFSKLTARELEILHYILKGFGSSEIAGKLNIKYNTVSTVRASIYGKSNTHNIRELFDLASRFNLT